MAKFNFEKNLQHQSQAVKNTIDVFNDLNIVEALKIDEQFVNPIYNRVEKHGKIFINNIEPLEEYSSNIKTIQKESGIDNKHIKSYSNIIDIMMETGTGKTYTYTKTIFELNRLYGVFKFVIVVPTLPIKAGTVDFLKSDSSREHFKEQYGKTLVLHIVESLKSNKNKKQLIPSAVSSFVNAGNFEKNSIQVMIINAGMINSDTMQKSFDRSLIDKYSIPLEAISATKPFVIIDEPHKFVQGNKTWDNIQKMEPQFILRYGATFPDRDVDIKNPITGKKEKIKEKDYHNLIYTLTAVDSFNKNLVKGVIGDITEFEAGKNSYIEFVSSTGDEATFNFVNNNNKGKSFKLIKKDSLEKIYSSIGELYIENLNKTSVILSNGIELKIGDKINPYSYSQTIQDIMIQKTIKKHFELEREFLKREVKIKPLTLFFIDNINEYRNSDGYLKKTVESYIESEIKEILKTESDSFYVDYLQKSLIDISKTHGGYFSKDNTDKDESIEQEVLEILHDKQAMLSLDNPRRFIFSKWTLREGWDNPNVFQICKLRSSGSEISKLQEVGRGLRLPVNEYGNRVKDEQFYLNYFVDFTENNFIEKLVNEINEKSGAISIQNIPIKLTDDIIKQIVVKYNISEDDLLDILDSNSVIKRNNEFKENGFEYIKDNFPLIFDGVNSNKIRKITDNKRKVTIRVSKYLELKDLWEKINQKAILEYKIKDENEFKDIFGKFLNSYINNNISSENLVITREKRVNIDNNEAVVYENLSINSLDLKNISTMKYSDFLKELSKSLNMNIKTLHESFISSKIEINRYLNASSIRDLKQKFNNYLLHNAMSVFAIDYHKVKTRVHPTKITDSNGDILTEINSSDIGVLYSENRVSDNYFFNELFYDSELEKDNIMKNISEVVVFTKIPKNSIRIPISGGRSYSPDFAYVLNYENGKKKLYFVVETKNTDEGNLRDEENQKIKHAEIFFGNIKIKFKKQFSTDKITSLIQKIYSENK